ncbi:hypothetical protein [Methylocella sp.]|uniref:hypothetical protein n=1 Tax=Methylocella sp. TaxID=1978226 RepID=UPI003784896C
MSASPFLFRAASAPLIAGVILAGLCFPREAQAGFFDFLFPPAQQQQYAPAYREPHAHVRKKRTAAKKKAVVAVRPHVPARVVASVMDDDGLQRGDAVMTDAGLLIYTGASDAPAPHSASEFSPLSAVKKLPARQREALLALDDSRARATLVTGRSVSTAALSAGRLIDGGRGVRIRYVGP